jgi:hypothetical protein
MLVPLGRFSLASEAEHLDPSLHVTPTSSRM